MARNKPNSKKPDVLVNDGFGGRFKQPDKLQFINVSFDATDSQWLHDNMGNISSVIDEFLGAANDGLLRITLTPDTRSGRWNAIAACCDTESSRFGQALSCRAKSPALALFALAYADGFKDGAWRAATDSSQDLFG